MMLEAGNLVVCVNPYKDELLEGCEYVVHRVFAGLLVELRPAWPGHRWPRYYLIERFVKVEWAKPQA